MTRSALFVILAASLVAAPFQVARAQETSRNPASMRNCTRNDYEDGLSTYAESRDQRLAAASTNQIEPGQNGSVMVHGWEQPDVLVRACIQTAAPSGSEARMLASQVKIAGEPGHIRPSGPSEGDGHHWNVSYEVWVPSASNLDVRAFNGSIGLEAVHGKIHFDTTNGSVHLNRLGGDVNGSTTNGSLKIELAGSRWDGAGLHAETVNGGVRVDVPPDYSAKFEASTVNGRVNVDFPITVSGEIGNSLSFQLGSGGPTIEARTTNGGIHIGRS